MTSVTPFLWFNDNAEDAIERYLKVFPDAELVEVNRFPDGRMFIGVIRIQGQTLTLMNGGPAHQLTEAFSLSVSVETQEEIDTYSTHLIEGGGELTMCGWLNDAFGLSWQIVPTALPKLMDGSDPARSQRVQAALMQMQKISIQGLQDAYDGKG